MTVTVEFVSAEEVAEARRHLREREINMIQATDETDKPLGDHLSVLARKIAHKHTACLDGKWLQEDGHIYECNALMGDIEAALRSVTDGHGDDGKSDLVAEVNSPAP